MASKRKPAACIVCSPGKQSNGDAFDEAAVGSIRWVEGPLSAPGHYQLRAWVIMANHVHVLANHFHVLLLPLITKYSWSSAGKSVETILDAADTSVRATLARANNLLF
ncbi:MAG: hypothetical protein M3Y27_11815 [Acidobacteriota bacterium]|nr:hypothetical protein [Acidobacteriota bacterium]